MESTGTSAVSAAELEKSLREAVGERGQVNADDNGGVPIFNFDFDGICMWIDMLDGPHINEFLCTRDNAIRTYGLSFDILKTVPTLPVVVCGQKPDESLIFRARLEDHNLTADGLREVIDSLLKMYGIFSDWTVRLRDRGKREHCCAYEFQYF